jgi:hypothetical protein
MVILSKTQAAYNHHRNQSDNRKLSRTIFKNRLNAGGFCFIGIESPKVRLFDY